MALSREKKHSRDLKEELSDKEIIDVEQNVKKDKTEKNDDKNELQEILDNVQAEKEALMSKLELLQNEREKIQSVTGGLISESFSILKKMCQITILSIFFSKNFKKSLIFAGF